MSAFGLNQPYESARRIPADILLEMIESKLDESLGMLEADNARRAREEIRIEREFGSFSSFMVEAEKQVEDMPEGAILPPASPSSS